MTEKTMTAMPVAHEVARKAGQGAGVSLSYEARFLRRKVLTTAGGLPFLVDLAQTTSLDHGDAFVLADRFSAPSHC